MLDLSTKKQIKAVDDRISSWIRDLAKETKQKRAEESVKVSYKEGDHRNLVTDLDRSNQRALIARIQELDADARFVCEEAGEARAESMDGQVWFVDPIDGTLNFVLEDRDYAIMVALYEDGKPVLGWICDVPDGRLFHGGPKTGVYENDQPLPSVDDKTLEDAVVIVSGRRLVAGKKPYGQLAKGARAFRVLGSAGISFTRLLVGSAQAYLSKLSPWDLAAGRALAEGLGYEVKNLDGTSIDMLLSNSVLIATTKIHRELVKMLKD
ncbi:inositol monophosphatase family protein [Fructobacillus sp. M1-13]|uniref:Inositol monophosphatase family protein n=1 Tax=Fructobacillus papyriferae TaxID=2713171 RepID=A0ABS5QP97_9LACO|nr:inositol monophosphatase family protein [Fructobacillus papyriferae]MBS9334622.1 inositol monophosphatase family protein [Fructobacillus papyriferae]MCD2158612.1 inositol monophosphatase family protein [Fructobacillus papyriferae]